MPFDWDTIAKELGADLSETLRQHLQAEHRERRTYWTEKEKLMVVHWQIHKTMGSFFIMTGKRL